MAKAAIEMGLALPFMIYLLYYTVNAFHSMHTSHVGQRAAAMDMYQRLGFRAQFAVDDVADRTFDRTFIAVQYTDQDGNVPRRRIILDSPQGTRMLNIIGICREPGCD